MLSDYTDAEICEFLEYGFPIGLTGKVESSSAQVKNHRGVTEFPREVKAYLEKEICYGAVIGPFDQIPFSQDWCVSPLNTVPKRDSTERRVILDLSFPEGACVNENIPKDQYLDTKTNLTFPRVDDLVDLIKLKGKGCHLFKRDLKRAYRQIPVDVRDVPFLGYTFENQFYFDLYLSMGLRSAAHICQRVTNAVRYMCQMMQIAILNYLDDLAGADKPELALKAYTELGNLLKSCGLEESKDKATPPSTEMVFIGVLFNTVDMTLSVTPERVQEILDLVEVWLHKPTATLKEVQSLIGKLSFVASCVQSSRVFIARLLSWLRQMQGKKSALPIPSYIHKDLIWWKLFLVDYNGISMMLTEEWSHPDEVFSCDACPSGCGSLMGSLFFHEIFPASVTERQLHINSLELLTVVVALKVWGKFLRGKKVLILCDNMSSCNLINKGLSRDEFHQSCLRESCYIAAVNEFTFKAMHFRGSDNRASDILSRWHLHKDSEKLFHEFMGDTVCKRVPVEEKTFEFSCPW